MMCGIELLIGLHGSHHLPVLNQNEVQINTTRNNRLRLALELEEVQRVAVTVVDCVIAIECSLFL